MKLRNTLLAAIGLAFAATAAHAGLKVGVVLSATGPAASLGIPEKRQSRTHASSLMRKRWTSSSARPPARHRWQ